MAAAHSAAIGDLCRIEPGDDAKRGFELEASFPLPSATIEGTHTIKHFEH
jgi:hypothetical protein